MTQASPIPFVESGSYPVREGNAVHAWIDGEPAFRRICKAIDDAKHSVWTTITFMWPEFAMPDERGAALDVLNRAAIRGVDVRLIFWRPDEKTENLKRNAFWGAEDHFQLLRSQQSACKIRWDCAAPGFCQHQKTWLIDAGEDTETTFVGGINLNPNSVAPVGHGGENENHDAYVELRGPSAVDVHHNFVQRWNEASERHSADGRWGDGSDCDLPFPVKVPAQVSGVTVQIQRTIHPDCYTDQTAAPAGKLFEIDEGERSNLDQYCTAIKAAKHTIYMENQYLEVRDIIDQFLGALKRGVEVILVMPVMPDLPPAATVPPELIELWDHRAKLGNFNNFMLAGLAGQGSDRRRNPIYVHSKLMLIDDTWATIGSCNLHKYSLFGNSEINAAISSPDFVRGLRSELFREHLNKETAQLDDLSAFKLFKAIANGNRSRHEHANADWQGLAFALDITSYGRNKQF